MSDIDLYDSAERDALKRLPTTAIIACSTPMFTHLGYPTRVRSSSELWRYADAMHEGRAEQAYQRLNGLTGQEFALLSIVTEHGARISNDIGKRIVPVDAPMMAVVTYRLIMACCKRGAVFEIGPGSGYLGAMLLADGFAYSSMDVCQAFHLWQSRLFWASSRWNYLYWWDWINHEREDFSVDVITANHVLAEMHDVALHYLVVRAERMLGDTGVMVVESYGDQRMKPPEAVWKVFSDRGWSKHGDFLLLPPSSKFDVAMFDANLQAVKPTRTLEDVVEMWRSIGREPSPDEKFRQYCSAAAR